MSRQAAQRAVRRLTRTVGILIYVDELEEWRVEINGEPAGAYARDLLEIPAWGHFTAMQVRGGRTRGLDFHLARLERAQRVVYDRDLDPGLIRDRIRHALDDIRDASVRVYAYWEGVIVVVRSPGGMPNHPHAMRTVRYQRPFATIKQSNGRGQAHFRSLAIAEGFDEGLLVDATGLIAEGTITNVGFWRDGTVVWPTAPALAGITMQVLQRELGARGVVQADMPVRISDLPTFDGMFLCNSRGWAPVDRVDDMAIPVPKAMTDMIGSAYDQAPQDVI